MSRIGIAVLWAGAILALASCGQKGPLYLPEEGGTIITRPGGPADDENEAGTEAAEESADPAQQPSRQPR